VVYVPVETEKPNLKSLLQSTVLFIKRIFSELVFAAPRRYIDICLKTEADSSAFSVYKSLLGLDVGEFSNHVVQRTKHIMRLMDFLNKPKAQLNPTDPIRSRLLSASLTD
jgi:hypothetical protein